MCVCVCVRVCVLQALAMLYAVAQKDGIDPRKVERVYQSDQAVNRMPFRDGSVSCLTPHGRFFSARHGRHLSGGEHLWLQGIGPEEVAYFRVRSLGPPDRLLKDLAGNAFSATVYCAVLWGALLAETSTL